jgi:hypothetical protein
MDGATSISPEGLYAAVARNAPVVINARRAADINAGNSNPDRCR